MGCIKPMITMFNSLNNLISRHISVLITWTDYKGLWTYTPIHKAQNL